MVSPNIPINQLVRLLSIYHDIFRDRHSFILKRVAIGCEPPASAGGPSGALRFDPNNVIDKLETNVRQNVVKIKWNSQPAACCLPADAPH
jgi:hypothetical protein